MWESTTGENPSRFSPKGAGASQIGAEDASNFPVESVSWNACQNFIEKLNEKLDALGEVPVGFKLRLPTEAEWERACRAGSETAYCFGDDAERLKEYGNREGDDDGWARAAPVRSFKPNAWGLFDMHGNVAEWCADRYVRETDGAAAQTNAAQTAAAEGARVFRGGSWAQEAKFCRSAYRNFRAAASFGPFCGLRLALSR